MNRYVHYDIIFEIVDKLNIRITLIKAIPGVNFQMYTTADKAYMVLLKQ